MLSEDRTMLAFAQRWAPYGRAPAGEIWIEFGMTPGHFYDHIRRILAELSIRAMPPRERERLEQATTHHTRESEATAILAYPPDDPNPH